MQTRDVTLRDYFRVFAAGRWALIIGAVAVAVIALLISFLRPVKYTAESIVYMGIATNIAGQTISTPYTTPVTATRTLQNDELLADTAKRAGLDIDTVRDGVTADVDRVPGASGGNQPTVAILTFSHKNKQTAIATANAYSQAALQDVQVDYQNIYAEYEKNAKDLQKRVTEIQGQLNRARAAGSSSDLSLVVLSSQLSDNLSEANSARIGLATMNQYRPSIISRAETASASSSPVSLAITTIFGAFIGLVLGAIVALIWKGSPAEAEH